MRSSPSELISSGGHGVVIRQSAASSLVTRLARLGWTRIGSLGIFGVPAAAPLCTPA
jgi:hypothetical protein